MTDGPMKMVDGVMVSLTDEDLAQRIVDTTPTIGDLTSYAKTARWLKEVGGIVVGGVPIDTDDRSKLMITGARVAADADPAWVTIWQGSDGVSYPVNSSAMVAISNAVSQHVSQCFAIFSTVKTDIDGGRIKAFADIDAAFA